MPDEVLERKGRPLEKTSGYRLSGGDEVIDRVGRVAITPVLAILGRGATTGAVLAGLTELHRLGFLIEAADRARENP